MIGSHIDTVINAGQFDSCYGVLAALEVVETLKASSFTPKRPIAVGAFTNEEGVRYAPDMMGSLVYAGGYPLALLPSSGAARAGFVMLSPIAAGHFFALSPITHRLSDFPGSGFPAPEALSGRPGGSVSRASRS